MHTPKQAARLHTDKNPQHAPLNWAHLGALLLVASWAALALLAGWSSFALLIGGLLLALAWFALWEWRWPHRQEWQAQRLDRKRDALFMVALFAADGLADVLIRGLLMLLNADANGPAASLPLWLAVPAAALLGEFGDYWLHRLKHRGGWLWRVHFVHHRPSVLNVTNNFTTHPLDLLLRKSVHVLPLWLLGFEPTAIALAALFSQTQSFATHANTRGTLSWLNYLIGSSELHRWHHSVKVDEALNFGTVLPFWDQLFGTFRLHSDGRTEPDEVGVKVCPQQPGEHDIRGLMGYPLVPLGLSPQRRTAPSE
ncbi:sterol desaturase family protein [Pseudomonas sp. 2FG]|uniref:sterol desaturase family protein n=1 Tax=Pseudomonas sp. 2FG TaxID=2502191 RepID=UPI00148510FA|nr:sterol desaturase family protein [Pseudomonas sp. 2FG]